MNETLNKTVKYRSLNKTNFIKISHLPKMSGTSEGSRTLCS